MALSEGRHRRLSSRRRSRGGHPLERFFEQWIYGSTLPRLTYWYTIEAGAGGPLLTLRVEQHGGTFDVPLTFVLDYADRPSTTLVVPVTERVVTRRVVLSGTLRTSIPPSRNDATSGRS